MELALKQPLSTRPPRRERMLTRVGRILHLALPALPYVAIAVLPLALLAPQLGVLWDRDEAAYGVIAAGMRHGLVPYRDLFDHKPPVVFFIYWFAFLPGVHVYAPRLLAIVSLGATGLVLTDIAHRLGYRRGFAIVAGLIFALSLSNMQLQMNANTEAFMVLPMTGALASLLRAERGGSTRWYIAAGILSGIAILTKTSAVFCAGALVGYLLARPRPDFRGSALLIAGAAAPVLICVLVFVAVSAGPEFWYANITYNRLYTEAFPLDHRVRALVSFNLAVALGGALFWLLALFGLGVIVARRDRTGWLLALWGLGAWLGIVFTGRGIPHYYVQLLPASALAGGLAAQWLADHFHLRLWRYGTYALLAPAALLHIALYDAAVRTATARAKTHALVQREYQCEADARGIGLWVGDHSQSGDRIYNLGRDSEIYLYAERLPAARYMYDRPFGLDPSTASVTAAALSAARPRFIVDTLGCTANPAAPAAIADLIAGEYKVAMQLNGASIYELRAGQ